MKNRHLNLAFAGVLAALSGCDDTAPMVSLGIDDTYYIYRMTKLPLESAYTLSLIHISEPTRPVNESRFRG